MHRVALLLIFALVIVDKAMAASSDEAIWHALKSGGHIVLIRHAQTESGIGDPPGFTLAQCSTQRNLSKAGQEDARRLGAAFRDQQIPVAEVLSSQWCRCLDTARLAFGRATPAPMLNSMFNDGQAEKQSKLRKVTEYIFGHAPKQGNVVMVTHATNIAAMINISPASGEMIIVKPKDPADLEVVGRILLVSHP